VTAFALREAGDADGPWIVARHGEVYAREHGWDATFERQVAGIVAAAPLAGWIAVDARTGERVGCVLCARGDDEGVAKLRALLVLPGHRGHGIGRALAQRCVAYARDAGFSRLSLWTVDALADARRLYASLGFAVTDERPVVQFGQAMVDVLMELDLGGA